MPSAKRDRGHLCAGASSLAWRMGVGWARPLLPWARAMPAQGCGCGWACPLHMVIPAPLGLEGGKGLSKITPPSKMGKLNQTWAQAHTASRGQMGVSQWQNTGLPSRVSTQETARPRCSTRGFCFPSRRVSEDGRPHPKKQLPVHLAPVMALPGAIRSARFAVDLQLSWNV